MKIKLFGLVAALSLAMLTAANAVATERRVVSVGGGLTEIIFAIGAAETLVADDTTSDFPAEAQHLPKVGYMRSLSAEGIIAMKPDLLITTREAGPKTVLKQLDSAGIERLELPPARSVDDLKADITKISAALGKAQEGDRLISKIDAQLRDLDEEKAKISVKPKVMFILSTGAGAPMVAGSGTAADSMITLSGLENVAHTFHGYKPLTPEAAAELKPQVIVVGSTTLEQSGGIEGVLATPGLAMTPAGTNKRIVAMDTMLLLGFGPRTVEAAQQLLHAVTQP